MMACLYSDILEDGGGEMLVDCLQLFVSGCFSNILGFWDYGAPWLKLYLQG